MVRWIGMFRQEARCWWLRSRVRRLDAEAEVDVRLIAGVGVGIVWGAVAELVTLAKFAAYEKT